MTSCFQDETSLQCQMEADLKTLIQNTDGNVDSISSTSRRKMLPDNVY